MGIPVGIEGMYPVTDGRGFYFDTWEDYESLLNDDLCFALDLSHINILRNQTRECRYDLLKELSSSDRCLEIHLSVNNGAKDEHLRFEHESDFDRLRGVVENAHPRTVVFYEGDLR